MHQEGVALLNICSAEACVVAACFDMGRPDPSGLQVAEQLYDVLASKAISSRQMPVLLLANKADCGAKAHSVEFIRKRLEKALDQLRTTRADVEIESSNVGLLPNNWTPALLLVVCAKASSIARSSVPLPD